jgi:cell pole-organizing protein PopZ
MSKSLNNDDILSTVKRLVQVGDPKGANVLMLSPEFRVPQDQDGPLVLRDPAPAKTTLEQQVDDLRAVVARNAARAQGDDVLVLKNPLPLADQDNEALEDMVSRLVRAELQGPLGERITANVRKLVRREIHRAFAVDELD